MAASSCQLGVVYAKQTSRAARVDILRLGLYAVGVHSLWRLLRAYNAATKLAHHRIVVSLFELTYHVVLGETVNDANAKFHASPVVSESRFSDRVVEHVNVDGKLLDHTLYLTAGPQGDTLPYQPVDDALASITI